MSTVDGVEFECTKCGDCCRWDGEVRLTPEDIERLAESLCGSREEFLDRYTRPYAGHIVLKDKRPGKECILMDGNKCGVYDICPKQCKEYPKQYESRCPGFKKGKHMNYEEAVKRVNEKCASLSKWDEAVSNQLYKELQASASPSSVAGMAVTGGVDPFSNVQTVKVASLDDLFAFHRAGDDHLIHKSTKDLWSIEADGDGVRITRLFDGNGETIKG